MKNLQRWLIVLAFIAFNAIWAWAADYTESKKIDGLADVSGADTLSTKIPAQDMNDTDKIGFTTIQSICDLAWTDIAAGDIPDISATYEVQLNNEAGLYGVLSDVSNFCQPGVAESLSAAWTNQDGAALDRATSSQAFATGETQTTVTAAHMLAAKWLTDVGGVAETDLILTAVSYYIDNVIVETTGNGFEICPPSGEALYLDGTAIAADDCIDGGGNVGDRAHLLRQQIADASWAYFLTTVIGTWADGNDTGD